ncbi:outer membrane beta-barrel protein [Methylobacterium sp. ID0610]|uniref:outer membrane beta-barrel protein n=1 Tax=Methylobacterium carpenticola TaxID=3344827 RepID=UPI0036C911ED
MACALKFWTKRVFHRLRPGVVAGLITIVFTHTAVAASDDDDSVPKTQKSGELEQPTISGPLKADPNPASFMAGPLGKINVSGVVTGYGILQNNPYPDDRTARVDFSNFQMIVQKADGPTQFYIQTGIYSIPALGLPNSSAVNTASKTYGFVPLIYAKAKLTNELSLQGGQMPSLFSGERTFTFQNMNVEQGLLFNQANNINKGLQIAYSKESTVITASLNDGFYSDRLTWLIGSVVYKIDDANRVSFSAGANLSRSSHDTEATPLLQNNSSIYNITYGYKSGPWIISPYIQFTHVPRDLVLGISESASTYGGALLASYSITSQFSLAGRIEYIAQSGKRSTGVTNLLYGPGSKAFSATITPTYQIDRYFVRPEYSYVEAINTTPGLVFGKPGTKTRQSRFVVETGILF